MPAQHSAYTRALVEYFSRALSSFQASGANLQIVCTAAASAPFREDAGHHAQPTVVRPGSRPRALIVLDSSFNPPTRAHLRMATSAIHDLTEKKDQRLGTLRLLLLLSVNNADKAPKPAAFDKRLAMMWAFARDLQGELGLARGERHVDALSVDIGLSTLPYFHEKSAALAQSDFYMGDAHRVEEKEGQDTAGAAEMEQVFLVGYDTLIRIFNPKYYGPVGSTAHVGTAGTTPMQKALDPFFARAKLRVTMRTGDEWGDEDEQRGYIDSLLKAEGLSRVGGSKHWGSRIELVKGREVGADIISSTYARTAAKNRDSDKLNLMVSPGVRWWIEQDALYTE